MSDQFTPQFYASNDGTGYPFTGLHDAFSRPFVDALVSLPARLRGDTVTLTAWGPGASFEVRSGPNILIPAGTPVAVTAFGDYVIWEAGTPECQASFVFVGATPPGLLVAGSYGLQERAISQGEQALYVVVDGQEVAGPGATLRLASGANVNLDPGAASPSGDTTVAIGAAFSPERSGCTGTVGRAASPYILTLAGLPPNKYGNVAVRGHEVYIVGKKPGASAIVVANVGEPCCDCPDYIRFYASMESTATRYEDVVDTVTKAQDGYRQLLSYVRFMLQAPIVGGAESDDPDRIAQAP